MIGVIPTHIGRILKVWIHEERQRASGRYNLENCHILATDYAVCFCGAGVWITAGDGDCPRLIFSNTHGGHTCNGRSFIHIGQSHTPGLHIGGGRIIRYRDGNLIYVIRIGIPGDVKIGGTCKCQ